MFIVGSLYFSSFHYKIKAKICFHGEKFIGFQCSRTQRAREPTFRLWKENFVAYNSDCKWKRAKIEENKNDFDIWYFIRVNINEQRVKTNELCADFTKDGWNIDEWFHPIFVWQTNASNRKLQSVFFFLLWFRNWKQTNERHSILIHRFLLD